MVFIASATRWQMSNPDFSKRFYMRNCNFENALKALRFPQEDSCGFSRTAGSVERRHSEGERPQVDSRPSCSPPWGGDASPPLLEACFLPGPLWSPPAHTDAPLFPSPSAHLPCLPSSHEQRLSQRSSFQQAQLFCVSLYKDLFRGTLIPFSLNAALTKFRNVPLLPRLPLATMARTYFVCHYSLACGNTLVRVSINKGRFTLTQKFQIKKGTIQSKVEESNLLLCAKSS